MPLFGQNPNRPLVKQAYEAWDAEDWQRAAELLEVAARQDPDGRGSKSLWFDAALAFKFLGNWPKAYELGKEAAARVRRGREEPAFWNLGIAATVLRDWSTARDSWAGYGLSVIQPGDDEIIEDFGPTPVRITTSTGQEVVWAQRICPTRARVVSVPFDPTRRFGEIVLHDGAPNGERIVNGQTFSVFDEILLFAESDLATLSVTVTASNADDIEALLAAFQERQLGAEVLGSGELLCKCCSETSLTMDRSVAAGRQTVLLAAAEEQATALLNEWCADRPEHRHWEHLHPAT